MNRADKIETILSTLRNEPRSEDLVFSISEVMLQDGGGGALECAGEEEITWRFRRGRFAESQNES